MCARTRYTVKCYSILQLVQSHSSIEKEMIFVGCLCVTLCAILYMCVDPVSIHQPITHHCKSSRFDKGIQKDLWTKKINDPLVGYPRRPLHISDPMYFAHPYYTLLCPVFFYSDSSATIDSATALKKYTDLVLVVASEQS